MKTFEELYNEIIASDELKAAFTEAAKSRESFETFMKAHDCPASLEEVTVYLNEQSVIQSLSDDALSCLSAGCDDNDDDDDHDFSETFAAVSVCTLFGCIVWTTVDTIRK